MSSRLEAVERAAARVTTPRGKPRRAEEELRRLWPARPDWINTVRPEWASLEEPPEDFVRLARSGERVLHEVLGGVAPTRLATVAMIRGYPEEPMARKEELPIHPAEPEPIEKEPAPPPPASDAVEEKIRRLETLGLWPGT
jgi:hypothetical protein